MDYCSAGADRSYPSTIAEDPSSVHAKGSGSLGTLFWYWGAFIIAVTGVIFEQRLLTFAATMRAVMVTLCTLSFGDVHSGGVNLVILPALGGLVASIVDLRTNRLVVIRGDSLRSQRKSSTNERH